MNFKDFNQFQLLQYLLSLGNLVSLSKHMKLNVPAIKKQILSFEKHFKPYNLLKTGYNRYGLSITSHDGGFSGIPNLTALREYNKSNNTNWSDKDFKEWTPFFKSCKELRELMRPFHQHIWRSHILRLNKGGFLPYHRDSITLNPVEFSFRLIISLQDSESFVFLIEKEKILLKPGRLYYINVRLPHSVFSYKDNRDFIIFNIELCKNSVQAIVDNLVYK